MDHTVWVARSMRLISDILTDVMTDALSVKWRYDSRSVLVRDVEEQWLTLLQYLVEFPCTCAGEAPVGVIIRPAGRVVSLVDV